MSTAGVCGTGSTSRPTVTTKLTSCTGGDDNGELEIHDPLYIFPLQVVVDMLGDAAQAAPICRYSFCGVIRVKN